MNGPKTYGMIAEFRTAAAVLHAAEKVRDAGFRKWDVFSPFPVHGMDRAMGLRNSKVGWFAFLGGVAGYATGMLMIWFMNTLDYPIVVGGKLMFSPYSAFPPSYELTILLGAFGSLFGMLFLNRLPRLHHPLLKNKRFSLVTHDRFFVVSECEDPQYSEEEARKLLAEAANGPVYPYEDSPVNTGRVLGTTNFVENNPLPITTDLLKRGQQRFQINCSPCHGALGDGNGITKKVGGMVAVKDLHEKRIVEF